MNVTKKYTADTGVCGFECSWCPIDPVCRKYNKIQTDETLLDQREMKKKAMAEHLNGTA